MGIFAGSGWPCLANCTRELSKVPRLQLDDWVDAAAKPPSAD